MYVNQVSKSDIHARIFNLVKNCYFDVIYKIPKKPETIPIIRQISASLTSIGANDQEANACLSNKDFIAKYSIVKKETNETIYWLRLIKEINLVNNCVINNYIKELNEILLIVSKIISLAKSKLH